MADLNTYEGVLHYLFRQLPMFQRVGPMAFKKDLVNIKALCKSIGNPQDQLRFIHVAGTNGKGSTSHMLASIYQSKGLRVGVYTSPHYKDFRERIKINGVLIPKEDVIQFVQKHLAVFEEIKPSFFEITVALSFDYFSRKNLDLVILETGLGGRLDSTNIVCPILSIITNISKDHEQFLGDTLPAIAVEKAGIIKQGVPVVIGETQAETKAVFVAKAKEKKAEISFADQRWEARVKGESIEHTVYDIWHMGKIAFPGLQLQSKGTYQAKNLITVLEAVSRLATVYPELEVKEQHMRKGLAEIQQLSHFLGRWQILQRNPICICDSGHNIAGVKQVLNQLNSLEVPTEKWHVVLGFVKDKKYGELLKLFPKTARYYFCVAQIPRALPVEDLQSFALREGYKGAAYSSVKAALDAALAAAKKEELIFIGGSTFVVAEVV